MRRGQIRVNEVHFEGDCAFIHLQHGALTIIDRHDWELVKDYHWTFQRGYSTNYVVSCDGDRTILLHRFLLGIVDGQSAICTDHINHDGLDNRRSNLRVATPQENSHNSRKQRRSKNPFKGVFTYSRSKQNGAERIVCGPVTNGSIQNPALIGAPVLGPRNLRLTLLSFVEQNLTLAECGERLGGVTRERARQLFARYGIKRNRVIRLSLTPAKQKKWRAAVMQNGQKYEISGFNTAEEAAMAYNVMARKHFGQFAWLNPVDMG